MQVITPNWPVPPQVRSLCSTRVGGVSAAPYGSLNLGDHVGDAPAAVMSNRAIYAQQLGAQPVYLKQVHGSEVLHLQLDTPDGVVADACLSITKNLACTIMVADCLPVLLTNRCGTAVAAAHAGWRGLCGHAGQGVLETVFRSFIAPATKNTAQSAIDSVANDLLVWLGPCIGSSVFEVGTEVREAFVSSTPEAARHFKVQANGKYLADLQALARQRLAALGISAIYGNDGGPEWCTVSNPELFFSHRRDRVSGRFAASIWLT